jgi:hypothetical protein
MLISTDDEEYVTVRLNRDVLATLGAPHDSAVGMFAAAIRDWYQGDPDSYVQHVVDEVQQHFHDTFIDTSWPSCPRHPNHPLWLRDGWWCCDKEKVRIVKLGEIETTKN